MAYESEIFRRGNEEDIWNRYCSFLNLSIEQFMNIQKHLLMEEIELVWDSPLRNKITNADKPASVEEFRNVVPLTTYPDYAPYLDGQNDEHLAIKPVTWIHTSGRGGSFKWVPCANRLVELFCDTSMATAILASATRKGEVRIGPNFSLLHNFPARPYASGLTLYSMAQYLPIRTIPPVEESERMEFQERIAKGFETALKSYRIDVITSMSSILMKTADAFAEQGNRGKSLPHPLALARFLRASLKARRKKRPILPRDIWPETKAVISWGADIKIYRDKIIQYWGKPPHEIYVFSEGGFLATQSWNKDGMTFFPNMSFLEFIPQDERANSMEAQGSDPSTVLLDELEEGKEYEIVVTNFYGMPFLRYRVGDLIRVTSVGDEETGVVLPQMEFVGRADELIDVFGIARLDEQTVWQAIVNAGITHGNWTLRKEYERQQPILHLYIEPQNSLSAERLGDLIHQELGMLDQHYREAEDEMGSIPWKVTFLSPGSFQRYFEEKRKAGADLSHSKPPHMKASDSVISLLAKVGG